MPAAEIDARLAVVLPCLDDWSSAEQVLSDLDAAMSKHAQTPVLLVDDGSSTDPPQSLLEKEFIHIQASILRLESNLGHQPALCIGLSEALRDNSRTHFVLLDSDGEDRPTDIMVLLDALSQHVGTAAVAVRKRRHSGTSFKVFNRLFQWLFRVLTGQELNFGNFMILTRQGATRVVNNADSWNNIPTSLIRSRAQIVRVPLDRGKRHAGQSKLGLVGLINHGLGAISVYSDVVFTRVIVASAAALGLSAVVGVAALVTRLFSGTPLPGWFALGTTAVATGSLVLLVSVTLLTFTMLADRRILSPPISASASHYIAERTHLPTLTETHRDVDA